MAKSISAFTKMLIPAAFGIVCVTAFVSSRQQSEQAAVTPTTLSPEAPTTPSVHVESDADFYGVPRSAPSADQKIMLEFSSMNNKCAVKDMQPCEASGAYKRVLYARGWCFSFDEWDVVYHDNKAWHRCSAARVASILRTERANSAYPGMLAFKNVVIPSVLAEASYEAGQNCGGLSGVEGRSELENHMRDINIRDFPREPGLWQAAEEWMQRLLDAKLAEKKAQGCPTLDPPMPSRVSDQGVIVLHRASPATLDLGAEQSDAEHPNSAEPSHFRRFATSAPKRLTRPESTSAQNDGRADDIHFDRAVENENSSVAKRSEMQ